MTKEFKSIENLRKKNVRQTIKVTFYHGRSVPGLADEHRAASGGRTTLYVLCHEPGEYLFLSFRQSAIAVVVNVNRSQPAAGSRP